MQPDWRDLLWLVGIAVVVVPTALALHWYERAKTAHGLKLAAERAMDDADAERAKLELEIDRRNAARSVRETLMEEQG
jgi:hypothetical protein